MAMLCPSVRELAKWLSQYSCLRLTADNYHGGGCKSSFILDEKRGIKDRQLCDLGKLSTKIVGIIDYVIRNLHTRLVETSPNRV